MSPRPDSRGSIRRRLLLFLLPPLALLMLLNVYVSYRAHLLFVQQAAAARFILASTWLMNFIQLDLTLLIVWVGVHFGLKPLLSLKRQIEAGSPRELKPLDAAAVPAEVKPLVDALNLLFDTLAETARSQRRFVADTAHQLRTPIAGLQGHLALLMNDPAAAAVRERLVSLRLGLDQLSHSANQLLALARADTAAGLTASFQEVDLVALVGRVVELNIDRAARAGIDLGAEAAPARVMGAPRLLEDLLGNLVDNALIHGACGGPHASPRAALGGDLGGGTVTVRCAVTDGRPWLEVEDDGPGIAQSERSRVRERFYRLPGATGHGTGLGLAIVEEIAQSHGAQLYLEPGAGGRGVRARVVFG